VAEEAGAEEAARIGDAGGDAANVAATGDGAAAAYRRARRWWKPWTERAAARWARDEWGKGAGLPGTDAGGRGPWGVREASDDGNWLNAGRRRTGAIRRSKLLQGGTTIDRGTKDQIKRHP